MRKYRLNTTISQDHHAILKKYVEDFGTQQSVLEHALESLEKSLNQSPELTQEEEVWMRIAREMKETNLIVQKDLFKVLIETMDTERFKKYIENQRPGEFVVEWLYNKPFKHCTLREIIDAIIIQYENQGGIDTINRIEEDNSYIINLSHSMGINGSKMISIMEESVLKSYGATYEVHFSKRSVYFKVFKNDLI